MRNLKIKLIEIWTLALIIIVSILFISNPSRVSASTATPLATPPATPTVSWSGTGNYQRIAGADSNDYSLSGMSSTINTDYGQANFDSSTATALGSKVKASTRLMVCNYVGFKSEITIPAKTKYTVVYNAAMYMNQLCSGNGSGYGWMVFYHMGDTDLSSSITFKWNNAGTYPSGVSAYLLNVYRRGTNSATRQITKTYENNTTTDKTFTEYFGLNTSDDYGSSYYYRHTDTVTMSSTVTFEGFVGPTKPTAQTSSKVYNGELQDFVLDNIDVNCLTKVEFSVGGNTETLFSVDPQDPTTQVGNSHIINGALRVKETGTYHLTFSLPASELWWSDGSTGDYDLSVEITPKPLQMSWATQRYDNGESGADNFFFMLPTPNVTLDMQNLLNDVKYYKFSDFDPGTGSILPGAQPIELANIEEGKDYYAIIDLKFETAGYNYKLEGDTFCAFSTRDNREIVVITLQNSGEVYDGNSHPAVVSATTTTGQQLIISQDIDFRYTYYLAGDPQYENGSDVAPVNAGTYKLVLEIKPNYNEDYRPYDSCEFNYVIDQAEPVLKPTLVNPSAKLYAGADLPEIVADVPAGGTPGTYTWDAGQKLRSGIQQYSYTFAPDSNNYKTTTGMMELATIDAKIQSISATINLPEGVTIYDSFDLEDLKEYLTVSGVYNNGDTVPNIYGYTITGTLTEGDSTLTIHYGTGDDEKTCRVTINGVVASKLEEITADFSQDGNVFTSSNLEDLKAWLEVKGVYNDGKSHGAIPGTSYELSVEGSEENGEDVVLPEGVSNIVVTYWYEGKEYKTKFPVNVKPVVLESITALFEPGLNEIKGTTPLRKLKDWLTITGTNNDGSAYETEITSEDYTLSGKLIPDSTSTITVRYQGKSTTFEVYVIPSANGGNRTLLPLPEIASPMTYTGALLDVLAGWAHIDLVEYVGNQATEVGKYRLILTIKDFDSYEWDTSGLPQTEVALQDMEGVSTSYTIEDDMLSVEWEIIPAVLKGTWNENGTLDLMVSSSFKGSLENVVTYKYYDKNGNEVTSLYEGETYTVEAILVDTKNFVMDDETTNLLSQPHEFTVPTTNKEPNKVMEFFKNIWNFIMLYWLWFLIGLIILLFLIFLIILLAKRRKKEEKEEEKPNEEPVKTTKEEIQVHMQQPMVQPMQGAILPTGATLAGLVTPNTNNEAEIAKIKAEKDAEIAKIKAEAEIAKAKAEMASQTQAQPVQQSVTPSSTINAEAEIAKIKAETEAQMAKIKAEAEIAKAKAEMASQTQAQPVQQSATPSSTINAEAEIAKIKAEKDAEIAKIKAEAEIAKAKAEMASQTQAQPVQQSVTPSSTINAEAEIAKIKAETEAQMAKIKAEAEIAKAKAEMASQTQAQPVQQSVTPSSTINAEAEIAKIKAETEAQMAKIKAEAEIAKAKAEMASQTQAQPVYVSRPVNPMHIEEAESYYRLREYEDRLRSMEREMQEQKVVTMVKEENQRVRKELEEEARFRRHEEEMRYLQELQNLEVQRRQDLLGKEMPNYLDTEKFEKEKLSLLQEQLRQKQIENQLLQEQMQKKVNEDSSSEYMEFVNKENETKR